MSVLEKIAYYQGVRNELPNQALAQELARTRDRQGIAEIAGNLQNSNQKVRSDCLKVLYEIGYIEPDLIAGFVHEFLNLLDDPENRMVWGGMIGLALIASQCPQAIWDSIEVVLRATEAGTVITKVWGVRTLAQVAATDLARRRRIFPFLIHQIQICLARDIPTHAESMLSAVDHENRGELLASMEARRSELSPAQLTRYKKIQKQIESK